MYYNLILYVLVLGIMLYLVLNNILSKESKEDFNSDINGNIVMLNRLVKRINNNPTSRSLAKLNTLDSIEI